MNPYRQLPFHDLSQLALSCPLCDHGYEPYQARIVKNKENAQLWYVMCSNCLHGIMLMVTLTDIGVNSVGIVTDMTSEDVLRFQSEQPISADDCLALHDALEHTPEQFL